MLAAITLGERFTTVLDAARAGADWAWAELYRDVAPPVLGYLRTRGAAEPEDLLGETFLQVVRDLSSFSGGERAFRSWVLTIAHRRLLDDVRRRGRRPVDPAPDEVLAARGGAAAGAGEDALGRLEAEDVRALLAELSEDQRTVLTLRLLGDMTVEEVARATGRRPGAVKALQRRGLRALERRLAERRAAGGA
jgi:RNA polymerase sigma factor (sigma-70 family)